MGSIRVITRIFSNIYIFGGNHQHQKIKFLLHIVVLFQNLVDFAGLIDSIHTKWNKIPIKTSFQLNILFSPYQKQGSKLNLNIFTLELFLISLIGREN